MHKALGLREWVVLGLAQTRSGPSDLQHLHLALQGQPSVLLKGPCLDNKHHRDPFSVLSPQHRARCSVILAQDLEVSASLSHLIHASQLVNHVSGNVVSRLTFKFELMQVALLASQPATRARLAFHSLPRHLRLELLHLLQAYSATNKRARLAKSPPTHPYLVHPHNLRQAYSVLLHPRSRCLGRRLHPLHRCSVKQQLLLHSVHL